MLFSDLYKKYFCSLFWLLSLSASALLTNAQPTVTFEAGSSANEVFLNSSFDVTFRLKNANGTNFTAPDFSDFTVYSGPNLSESMQIVNGQVSRETGYSFTLKPTRTGTFTIGSASITVNNELLKSPVVEVKVLPGSQMPQSDTEKKEAYVQLETNKTEAYPGEQISLNYKLYTTVSLDGYDINKEPDYKGFYVQELRRFSSGIQQETINGRQVTSKVLRRLALFPQQTGQLVIPPAQIQLAMIEDNSQTGFFFSRNIKPLFIETAPVNIIVKELPPNQPADFTGAVGQFTFQASVNRRQISTDDAFSVVMIITGNGDIKRVQPPPLSLSDSIEVYPPKIIDEELAEENGNIVGRKIIEYLALPKYPGIYNIQPTFSYFNPETSTYEKAMEGPFPLIVKQGSEKRQPQIDTKEELITTVNIRPIKPETDLSKKDNYIISSMLYKIFLAIPLLAFIGILIINRPKTTNLNQHHLKQANKIALQRLTDAKKHLSNNAPRAFYDEILKASLNYISDKLNIPLSELSKNNIQEKLAAKNISANTVAAFLKIINDCEVALFSGRDDMSNMETVYDQTTKLITTIEEEIDNQS